jgi:putative hemolysin
MPRKELAVVLFFVAVATALGISAICSLLEATLLSVTPSQVAELSARRPRVGAIWRRFKHDIERPIAVILILNTAAHTILFGPSVASGWAGDVDRPAWLDKQQ